MSETPKPPMSRLDVVLNDPVIVSRVDVTLARAELTALRAERACEICRDVESMATPTPATICGAHYHKVVVDMEACADENEKLRAERDKLRELLLRICSYYDMNGTIKSPPWLEEELAK